MGKLILFFEKIYISKSLGIHYKEFENFSDLKLSKIIF